MKFQFRLRTLLLLFLVLAVVCAIGVRYLFPKSPTFIVNRKHWDEVTKSNNCVLFVNGSWSPESVYIRKIFGEFAKECLDDFHAIPIVIELGSEEIENEKAEKLRICDELWESNKIQRYDMRNFGGAGRVVWLKDGKAVKFSLDLPYINNRILTNDELSEHFRTQTKEAFQ